MTDDTQTDDGQEGRSDLTCHGIDVAADEFAESLVEGILGQRGMLAGAITRIVCPVYQTAIAPWEARVYTCPPENIDADGAGFDVEVGCTHSRDSIPGSVDDDDLILDALVARHSLESMSWGSLPSLPLYAYRAEHARALSGVLERLSQAGIAVAPGAAIAWVDDEGDVQVSSARLSGDSVAKAARRLPPAAREDFARSFYQSHERRRWFLGLMNRP